MSGARKRYKLELADPEMSVTIDVDHAVLDPVAEEVNNFWIEPRTRLLLANGSAVTAAIKLAGSSMLALSLQHELPHTIQREFDELEGFPPAAFFYVDSEGLPEFDSTDLTLSEVPR